MRTQLQLFGLWPFERLLWLDWHGHKVGSDCLAGYGCCQGMMGNKDIIECKSPVRKTQRDGESVQKTEMWKVGVFSFLITFWHNEEPPMYPFSNNGIPRCQYITDILSFIIPFHLGFIFFFSFFFWTMQRVVLINYLEVNFKPQKAKSQYTLHSPKHKNKERQKSRQQAGWEVKAVKEKLGWVTVHDREKTRQWIFRMLFQQAGEVALLNNTLLLCQQ